MALQCQNPPSGTSAPYHRRHGHNHHHAIQVFLVCFQMWCNLIHSFICILLFLIHLTTCLTPPSPLLLSYPTGSVMVVSSGKAVKRKRRKEEEFCFNLTLFFFRPPHPHPRPHRYFCRRTSPLCPCECTGDVTCRITMSCLHEWNIP